MLDELLDDWAHRAASPPPTHISLWDQVESELEARFAQGARRLGERSQPGPFCIVRGAVLDGKRTADLRISRPDGQRRALAGDPAEHHRGHQPRCRSSSGWTTRR